ncbi:MAG: IreB family regulatory phosphoprotein [Lachnospiraceae bacterium]|jgi:uncharacterized protein (UPF0297 family)|nr:IreB family regulatory phosphoprotein [Lachnospiraceae bacterium]
MAQFVDQENLNNTKLGDTQFFQQVEPEAENGVKLILDTVYHALTEKGYNPVNQIVGYIMSGDPTYITNHQGARSLIMKVERDELVEELLKEYIKSNNWR